MHTTTLYVQEPTGSFRVADTDDIVGAAKLCLNARFARLGDAFTSPQTVRDYLCVQLGLLPYEVFAVLYLNSQNRLISFETPFRGTLNQTSVYPREIVKRALELDACSVIISHNHPSGESRPSRADENLTQTLKAALALVDVRVLDHIIVAGAQTCSMAEMGLV
jgi:DNA repair protein RadC